MSGCARNYVVLRSDEQIYFIPKGERFKAIWDGKLVEVEPLEDMVALYKGSLLKLQAEANRCDK